MLSFMRKLLKLNHRILILGPNKLREERNDPDKTGTHPWGYKVVPPPPPPLKE